MSKKRQKLTGFFEQHALESIPDLTEIYKLAYGTIDRLPRKFFIHTSHLFVRVENFADQATLASLNLEDKYDLLGLYRGIPLPLKSSNDSLILPDIIFLYRCPLIRFSYEYQEDLEHLIHHVMIHEIGHHFGFSDSDLYWIEKDSS